MGSRMSSLSGQTRRAKALIVKSRLARSSSIATGGYARQVCLARGIPPSWQ